MPDDDPNLDAALAALSFVEPSPPPTGEDDDRWAKRVASRVSTFAPPSRRELDPVLAAPFPDDHQDFDGAPHASDDHAAGHAADAADFGDAHGWEGSMSDDESTSRPPNSLAALSGLTRSGPATSSKDDMIEGAAKGDDSGLIDLRAMSQPEPEPVAADAPVAAAAVATAAANDKAPPVSLKSAEAPASAKAPAASAAAAAVPPSSTTATAASAPATAPRSAEKKKGGAVVWLGLGGLAAAAAAAFFFVGPMAKKDEAPGSAAAPPPAAQAEDKKKADEKVAVAEKPAATEEPAPQASAAPSPTDEAVAAKPGATATGTPGSKIAPIATASGAGTAAAKPTASAAPTATEAPKSAGTGSLDEVLGIGKDQPTKKVEATDNLPDKPDSMDVRSAINGKLSAANACVKGLEGPSNASVTFGPSGAVSGVVVTSGPAKGTGAESCVKNAFSSAKVPPSKKGASGSATLMP
jgi:hypothetical protein